MPEGPENAVQAEVIQLEFNGVTQYVTEAGIQGEGVRGKFPSSTRILELRVSPNRRVVSGIHKTVLDHTVQIGVHIIAKNPITSHIKSEGYRVGTLRTCLNGMGIKIITAWGCIGDGGRQRYGVVARIGNEDGVVSRSHSIKRVVVPVIGVVDIRPGLNPLGIDDILNRIVLIVEDHHMKGETAVGKFQLQSPAVNAGQRRVHSTSLRAIDIGAGQIQHGGHEVIVLGGDLDVPIRDIDACPHAVCPRNIGHNAHEICAGGHYDVIVIAILQRCPGCDVLVVVLNVAQRIGDRIRRIVGLRVYLHRMSAVVGQGDYDVGIVIAESLNSLYGNYIRETLALHGPWQHQKQE